MVTAVDSSVLMAIDQGEPGGSDWLNLLQHVRESGKLVVCDVVVAEVSGLFRGAPEVVSFLQNLQIHYDPIRSEAAILAGGIFKAYRQAGGPRLHLIPDFLIGSHALHQADQLAAADRGYLRRHFPRLKVVAPR